jgi:NADPH-dependent glutamate synthase beta subunit-like oxidoreductase
MEGSEYRVDCDMVIEAIGQRPDTSFISSNGIKVGRGGTIVADPRTLATDREGIFAGGDTVTGPQTVIEAIAAGQRAASSIRRYLRGEELGPRVEREDDQIFALPPAEEKEVEEKARVSIAELPVRERVGSFIEVASGYSEEQAMEEASRCLRCDVEVGGE